MPPFYHITHIILTNMNTLGSDCKSYIDSIIDQERHPMFFCKIVQLLGGLDQVRRLTCFVTMLNDGNT